ncbi:MAG: ferric reductase-like transmembrane domain-containing protein [Actinomycetota bacterium]|nr:ferric reductase-like transmembrane domain-containing protein [Actinomycetota bacterium]
MTAFAALGPTAYWYLARGTGAVSLLLFTMVMVLGLLGSLRVSVGPRWPRFALDTLHRDVSLLAVALLVVHILTSVLDGFAPIALTDAVIPFGGTYRPLWLGLGALALDIMLALVITSLVRRRLGFRSWRAVHWLAYASWPVAVLHGLGTGTDSQQWWMLTLTAACVAAVTAALALRIARSDVPGPHRAGALAATATVVLGAAVFTLVGPLQRGWARRAGTPTTLLAGVRVRPLRAARGVPVAISRRRVPFSAAMSGTLKERAHPGGNVLDMELALSGGASGLLRVRLAGRPLPGGGLSMTGSQVDLAAAGLPGVMAGRIVSLQGQRFVARVSRPAGGQLDLAGDLQVPSSGSAVTGTLRVTASGSGG